MNGGKVSTPWAARQGGTTTVNARDGSRTGLLDGRYRILGRMGGGATGRTFRALHVGLQAIVVLKELRLPTVATGAEREAARARFLADARRLAALRHRNLPRVHNYFCHSDACFLVMDFVAGEPLAAHMERLGRLGLAEVYSVGSQLCDVLTYLRRWNQPAIWGDLHVSDIILAPDGRAVLVDFGAARRWAAHVTAGASMPRAPGSGALQHPGSGEEDERADLIRLGAVLYQLASGTALPPSGPAGTPLHEVDPNIPPILSALIGQVLNPGPAEQMTTVAELTLCLHALASVTAEAPRSQRGSANDPEVPPAGATLSPASADAVEDILGDPGRRAVVPVSPGMEAIPLAQSSQDSAGSRHAAEPPDARTQPPPPGRDRTGRRARHARSAAALALAGLSVAVVLALALALSLVPGPDTAGQAPRGRPSSGARLGATPTSQLAGNSLAAPPPTNAQPPVRSSFRTLPTPTVRPTDTPAPMITPTTRPTMTSTATVSPTPAVSPTPGGTPSPDPSATTTPGASDTPTPSPAGTPDPAGTLDPATSGAPSTPSQPTVLPTLDAPASDEETLSAAQWPVAPSTTGQDACGQVGSDPKAAAAIDTTLGDWAQLCRGQGHAHRHALER
jgi:serine/threonine protein kinase